MNMVRLFLKNRRRDLLSIPGQSGPWRRDGALRRETGLVRDTLKVQYPPDLLIGMTCAYIGRWVDATAMRFVDLLFSFPIFVLALMLMLIQIGRAHV